MFNETRYVDFTFTGGVSNGQPLAGYTLVGLIVPAAFTATGISIQAAKSMEGNFLDVYDATNTQLVYTVDATNARQYDFSNDFPFSADYIKLKAATAPNGSVVTGLLRHV